MKLHDVVQEQHASAEWHNNKTPQLLIHSFVVLSERMSYHPSGITNEIVGTEVSSNGRTCGTHDICGSVLCDDVVVRLRKVQILTTDGAEETAIAVYLVSDGIDQCRVGFLPRHLVSHAKKYDGALAQITEVYTPESESSSKRKKYHHNRGCCVAAIISSIPPPGSAAMPLLRKQDEPWSQQWMTVLMLLLRMQRNKEGVQGLQEKHLKRMSQWHHRPQAPVYR